MKKKSVFILATVCFLMQTALHDFSRGTHAYTASQFHGVPPFLADSVAPMVMLVMSRDQKLYVAAYDDASDLNGDGKIDVGYQPNIDYYGYFDSYKYYSYSSTGKRFAPVGTTANKKAPAGSYWSGDFLNYLTMSRMDCIRKVLYGGSRSTDTATETVLQRTYIPQDEHTWGKEYTSVTTDGYDIRDYTPLALPVAGTRHLFASTTLSENGEPLLRVLPNNIHRIWEWVGKKSPEADNSLENTGPCYTSSPVTHADFDNLISQFANANHLQGSQASGTIDGGTNPFGSSTYYLDVFTGRINIATDGIYSFAVDGDDAEEVMIDGQVVAGHYGTHGPCNCQTHWGSISLTSGSHAVVFRHQQSGAGAYWHLYWKGPDSANSWQIVPAVKYSGLVQSFYDVTTPPSTIADYVVRVKVADASMPETNCKLYPSGGCKPVGLLQRNGESDRMYFGLMTGSYAKNTSGGVLRKNIGTIRDEIDSSTGQFTALNGIIRTIDRLRIIDYDYASYAYDNNCGWIATHPLQEGQCRMWGNPLAEMMYETLRYYAGKAGPTAAFTYDGTNANLDDNRLGLPLPAWVNPYDPNTGHGSCAQPIMLVISDISPNYDTDQLPGSPFKTFAGDLSNLDVGTLADLISTVQGDNGLHFIGVSGTTEDGACSSKNVNGFGWIRGLCPDEPTKQGGYYSASVAYFGRSEDINAAVSGTQKVLTYAVGLAPPFPDIKIPVGGKRITLVPFAKSVASLGINPARGAFQPTNTIAKVFVDKLDPGHPAYGKFRVNFEDQEQGADFDMDAIVAYEYQVLDAAGKPVSDPANGTSVEVTLTSEYAAGGTIQHVGYIISGTTQDGTYLDVRDFDTNPGTDIDYYQDTPPGKLPNTGAGDTNWADGVDLPLITTRTFTPSAAGAAATLLKNPLWYAAKWGGFDDQNGNLVPDLRKEWDKDGDGVPDTYFYVTNPLKIEEQLYRSFADILRRSSSGTAASVMSSTRTGEGAVYRSIFYPEYKDALGNTIAWCGDVHSLFVDSNGNLREDTNGNHQLDLIDDQVIVFNGSSVAKYRDSNGDQKISNNGVTDETVAVFTGTQSDIRYLWRASSWLNHIADADVATQRTYASTDAKRFIFTFIDANQNRIAEAGEQVAFACNRFPSSMDLVDPTQLYPYIQVYPPFEASAPAYIESFRANFGTQPAPFLDFIENQTQRVINFIRGQDQGPFTATTTPTYTIPAFRSRKADVNNNGQLETWRLGDIIYSTPTFVGAPAEGYHLLYQDSSYASFVRQYSQRRGVVYVGGNDGMIHAFNAGFYDKASKTVLKGVAGTTQFELGSELWAYVPYNLLPHLYWLTEPGYAHVYFCDLPPRVFDAKIFAADADHPGGWGTVLVQGMRFGGGRIVADMDKTDGLAVNAGTDRTLQSAYVVMDITNPEVSPKVMAELTLPGLGYTTCYPSVVSMNQKDAHGIHANAWYLVIGSGPSGANGPDSAALAEATSVQPAKLYVIDLIKLGLSHQLWSLNSAGAMVAGANIYQDLDGNSFVSNPISVDFNLDYSADVIYFGTVSGNAKNGWGGKLRRVVVDNDPNPIQWTGDNVFMDLTGVENGQCITAAPTAAVDFLNNRWVYFGTGRFFNRRDAGNADQQSYYGLKEPLDVNGNCSWAQVTRNDLLDTSTAQLSASGAAAGIGGIGSWTDLLTGMDKTYKGWYLNFLPAGNKERNLGQAALLGELLTFTTYIPSLDPCILEGTSNLYGLYYKTGTAHKQPCLGTAANLSGNIFNVVKIALKGGLAQTPSVHVGAEAGSKVFIQTTSGGILGVEQLNPVKTVSGISSWRDFN